MTPLPASGAAGRASGPTAYSAALSCYQRGQLRQARAGLDALLDENPRDLAAWVLSGVIAGQERDLDTAVDAFDHALAIDPENASGHFNRANILLLRGEWERGWADYEWRWKVPELATERGSLPDGPRPWLGGEDLAGKSILLRCEQGLGDTLQFCRYVKCVAALGARVILEVQRPLVSLLADLDGISQILVQGARLPECDFYCLLMSLPLAFKTTVGSVPYPQPYLASDASKVDEWRARLGESAAPRVGLVWRGTSTRANDDRRSIPLELLLRHLPRSCRYVALQKDIDAEEARILGAHPSISTCAEELHDFSDTAAVCACLDRVISIDTSVAHLSCALGKPTWILLQFSPAWRWLLDREDSPWYASARLFRQPAVDDWVAVCERVGQELRAALELEGPPA